MLTQNTPVALTAARVRLSRLRQTSTSGGSSDRALKALTVVPTRRSSWQVVTTVTPAAKLPIALRNSAGSAPGSLSRPRSSHSFPNGLSG
jgi:hypothetical protein